MTSMYTKDERIIINNDAFILKMTQEMSGIGGREYFLNNKKQRRKLITLSSNISEGNHTIYTVKLKNSPDYKIDILIHEKDIENIPSLNDNWIFLKFRKLKT